MSATTETILLQVDIAANNARLVELQKQLNANKTELAALNATFKAGNIDQNAYADGQVRLKAAAANTGQEIRILTKANQDQATATKASTGSIAELRAQLSTGTAAYNGLSAAERDNTTAGQKLQATNKAISDQLKVLEKNIGDTRRGVGDYNAGIKDVNVVSGQLTSGLQTVATQGLAPFQGQLDKGAGLLAKFKGGSDLVKQGLAALKPAGEEGAGGFKAVAAGIALTGIGVFLLVLGSVISYFTSTNEGGKILKQGLAGLGAVVTTVANLVTGAGKGLVQAFKDPKVALQDLMGFLKDQVVNRLASFGVIIDGIRNRDFKKITDGIIQFNLGITNGTDKLNGFGNGIADAVTQAANLEAQFQALKKSRAKLEADEILEKGRVEELIRLSKDRTVSASQRLNQLREAGKLEGELSAKSLKQTTDELNAIKQRNAAKGLSRTADEIQEERDKQKEYNNTVVERNNTLATIKARQSRFILEERAELAKDQKERKDAALARRTDAVKAKQTEVEQQLLEVAKGTAAELVLLQRKIDLAAALTLASEKKTAADRTLILATAEAEKQQLQADFNAKAIEAAKKHDATTVAEATREYAESLQLLENYLNDKRAAIERDYAAGKISENQYQKQLNALEKAGLDAQRVVNTDYRKDNAKANKSAADLEIKENNRVKNEKKKIEATKQGIQEKAVEAGIAASDAIIGALGAESEAGQVALAIKKTLALAEIGINLQKQLSANAVASASITAEVPAPAGPILAAAYLAVADAFSIAGAAAGAAAVLKFNTGGMVPGTGSTDTVPAMLTPGEVVMNQQASQTFTPLLSYLNTISGGKSFGPASSNDGGLAARQAGGGGLIDYDQLATALSKQPVQVDVRRIAAEQARSVRPRSLTRLGG